MILLWGLLTIAWWAGYVSSTPWLYLVFLGAMLVAHFIARRNHHG
jgi:hypothetical protein